MVISKALKIRSQLLSLEMYRNRQLSQVSRTFNLTFNFKVNYEDAKAFRKANGGYLRGGRWNDLLVEVYII